VHKRFFYEIQPCLFLVCFFKRWNTRW